MKLNSFLFLLLVSSNLLAYDINQVKQPYLYLKEGVYILNLPPKMELALKNFNASFIHWNTNDYTPKVLNELKEDNNSQRAPFALIVDVNKDSIFDVILDGKDNNNSLLICIISDKDGYKIILVDEHPLIIPEEIENYNDGKREVGLNYFLWLSKSNRKDSCSSCHIFTLAIPQQTDEKGELVNNGGMIDYYFEDGRFKAEMEAL